MFGTKHLKAALVAAPLALAGLSASAATIYPDFMVDEGSVPLAADNIFAADKIVGGYVEVVTFTPYDPNVPTSGTFTTSIKWEAGQYWKNDGTTTVSSQLGSFGDSGYKMYGLLTGSGTFSIDGFNKTSFVFDTGVGSLVVYIDPNSDTTFSHPSLPDGVLGSGSIPWTTGSASDDILIATGGMLGGAGTLDPTLPTCGETGVINCGSFGTTTSFSLTSPEGTNYFISPVPFFDLMFEAGQLNNFTVSGTQVINGSLDVVFGRRTVPVPATLGLFGAGLLGLGAMVRRKA
jgi:hypothetical protein